MRVLLVEPGKAARPVEMKNDLHEMQHMVGGPIQALYPWEEPVSYTHLKEPVTVTDQDGVRREIMAYTMNSPYKDKPAMPSVSYLEGILNGCRQNGIDTQTVIEAVRCTQQELPQKVVPHKKQRHPKHKEER